ncbi:hypothetical protein B4U80_02515 [Leptotrombidium deliense]|uniref:Transmembrane protein 127 transmembrane region domain-containing protein n=1 Tax=Leptotrombidium deliense TaxID=299467 RepID=A0A443RYC7_9ACAR|nr:hypothetical protein B4U80_02515 [Leptotrombidium deliense]
MRQWSSVSAPADRDKNIMSAIVSILVIATIATAIAQPKWFSIKGGSCNRKYIGLQEFFYVGTFSYVKVGSRFPAETTAVHEDSGGRGQASITSSYADHTLKYKPPYHYPDKTHAKSLQTSGHSIIYYGSNGDLKNCVTPEIVSLQRMIIALCFFAIIVNLIQFFLDTLGTSKNWINFVRKNAIATIFGVLLTIIIIGVAYTVGNLLEREQKRVIEIDRNSAHNLQFVEIRFELSYYLITFAGILGLIGASFNLFRKPTHYLSANDLFCGRFMDSDTNTLLDDHMNPTHWSQPPPTLTALVSPHQIPPPPYAP